VAAEQPWFMTVNFVNPHDIAFNGWAWEQLLGYPPVDDDTVPDIAEAPSAARGSPEKSDAC